MTPMLAPARTPAQQLDALRKANRVRSSRATVKRAVFDGAIDITEIIDDPPADVHGMKIHDLLLAQRGWGPTRVRRLMRACGISYAKTVGGLSIRQRTELLARLAS